MSVMPRCSAAGVIVSVRLAPAPLNARFAFGTSVVFDEVAATLTLAGPLSASPTVKFTAIGVFTGVVLAENGRDRRRGVLVVDDRAHSLGIPDRSVDRTGEVDEERFVALDRRIAVDRDVHGLRRRAGGEDQLPAGRHVIARGRRIVTMSENPPAIEPRSPMASSTT